MDITSAEFKILWCAVVPEFEKELMHTLVWGGAHCIAEYAARGSVSSELKQLLGIADDERFAVTAVVRAEEVESIKQKLNRTVFNEGGRGIAIVLKMDAFMGLKTAFKYIEEEEE